MGMDYTQQKLWEAVRSLVMGHGRIQERLANAGVPLAIVHSRAFEGHAELRERFEAMIRRLTTVQPIRGGEGSLKATTPGLADDDAAKIAEEIFSLFCEATDLADTPVGFESRRRH